MSPKKSKSQPNHQSDVFNNDIESEQLDKRGQRKTRSSASSEKHVFVKKELDKDTSANTQDVVSEKRVKHKKKNISSVVSPSVSVNPVEETVLSKDEERHIDQKLTEIYENGDGTMPDMKTFEKRKKSKFLTAFFVLLFSCVFFGVVAWLGFFVIQPQSHFSEEDVVLSISGQETVKAGQENTYRIRYRNAQNVALNNVRLEVRYPKGFQYTTSSVSPISDNNDTWDLGTIAPQGSGYIDVTGRMFASLGEEQSFRIFLNYTPSNFSSSFQKVAHLALTANESVVRVDINAPTEVSVGSEVGVTITLTPEQGEKLEHIRVVCDSELFAYKEEASEPKSDEGRPCQWSFDSLDSVRTITFTGSFSSEEAKQTTFGIDVLGWNSPDQTGDGYVLAHVQKDISLVKTDTIFNLAINGGVSSLTAEPGDILNMSMQLRNAGEVPLDDAVIRLMINAPAHTTGGIVSILDWNKLDTDSDADLIGEQVSDTVRRGILTWDKRYIRDLDQVNPGEEIKENISLPIKNNLQTTLSNFDNFTVDVIAEIQYGTGDDRKVIDSNRVTLTIVSDFDLEVRDEVTQNDADKDVHTVTWLLSNSFHELHDIVVKADIYGDVDINKDAIVVPAGEVEYDTAEKKLVWTIDQMPLGVDVLAMQFDVTLLSKNETQTQLTSKVEVRARDTVAQTDILTVGDEILLTTD